VKVLETVIRRRSGGNDPRTGDPLPTQDVPIPGVRVAPLDTRENTNAANTVVTGFTLQLPPGTDILPTDQLKVRGFWREVIGEPFDAARKGILVTVQGGRG
jgi:hypothetical protein